MPIICDVFDQHIGLTNALLTEDETHAVKSRYHARRRQIGEIDRLYPLAEDRTQLWEDRIQLVSLLRRYRLALSSHKRLPTEILQQIFLYASAEYDQDLPRPSDPPWLLCGICLSWRHIAITTPALWKSLHFPSRSRLTRAQKLHISQIWLARAGRSGFSLTWVDDPDDLSSPENFVKKVIAPYANKFRYLRLNLTPPDIDALFSLPAGSLDSLEEFHLVYQTGAKPPQFLPSTESPILLFSPRARIRRIRINLTPYIIPSIFCFPWHKLESFRCDSGIESSDCHSMLLSCQALRKIQVRVFGIKNARPLDLEISLPNLTTFAVNLCDEEDYDPFFLPLVTPSLRSLLIFQYAGRPWSPGMYNALVERSKCDLEELYLGTLDAETPDVLRLFECTPSLTSVTFSHKTTITPEVLEKIGRCDIGVNLTQLFLKGTHELDPILHMLELRERSFSTVRGPQGERFSTSPLKFVETHCRQEEVDLHDDRIWKLRDRGFEISLLPEPEDYYQL